MVVDLNHTLGTLWAISRLSFFSFSEELMIQVSIRSHQWPMVDMIIVIVSAAVVRYFLLSLRLLLLFLLMSYFIHIVRVVHAH